MKNTPYQNTVISPAGEKQLIRAAQITVFLSELLVSNAMSGSRTVSCEGMAAVMECLSDQMEQIIGESSLMNKEIKNEQS